MKTENTPSLAEFFGWSHHPFADTRPLPAPFLSSRDLSFLRLAADLLSHGKSFALCGPSGAGKSTLLRHLLDTLDPTYYCPVFVPYGGLNRTGLLRALSDGQGRRHPVIAVDDAQMLERSSLFDLCALTAGANRQAVAASLVLAGDALFRKSLQFHVLDAVSSRLACVFPADPLDDKESRDFLLFRLQSAKAPAELFDRDALHLLSSACRGNRRALVNAGMLLLSEAYARQEKTVGSELVLHSDLLQASG